MKQIADYRSGKASIPFKIADNNGGIFPVDSISAEDFDAA